MEFDPHVPDPPLREPSKQVRNRAFASARRGFDRKQVDGFLDALASRLEGLEKELAETQLAAGEARNPTVDGEAAPASSAVASVDGLDPRLGSLVEVIEGETVSMLAQVRAEAADVITDARNEAADLRTNAQEEVGRLIEEARASLERAAEEARQILLDSATRRQEMLEGLQQMQERLLSAAHDLDYPLNPAGFLETD